MTTTGAGEKRSGRLNKAKAQGKKLGRHEKDPSACWRIVQMRERGLSLCAIAQSENLSPAGVLKILRRITPKG